MGGNRVLKLDSLLSQLGSRPDPQELLAGFVPPSRFASKSFANYDPRHPTQAGAAERLANLSTELGSSQSRPGLFSRLVPKKQSEGKGVYLDGGFGVGKTHLLAALWNAAPGPKSYLSFDELMYFVGMFGGRAPTFFARQTLIAIDEWELDDPGNLKMALAYLRGVLNQGAFVAVTSNTLPLELGAGRFSQKDFLAEVEEIASRFDVIRIEGEDYRHRQYVDAPGQELFWSPPEIEAHGPKGPDVLPIHFELLLQALGEVHPIRYRQIADFVHGLIVEDIVPVRSLATSLRWVHFVDSVYDAGVPFAATGEMPLKELFAQDDLTGPFGKKLSRCLSRMEELLTENRRAPAPQSSETDPRIRLTSDRRFLA